MLHAVQMTIDGGAEQQTDTAMQIVSVLLAHSGRTGANSLLAEQQAASPGHRVTTCALITPLSLRAQQR